MTTKMTKPSIPPNNRDVFTLYNYNIRDTLTCNFNQSNDVFVNINKIMRTTTTTNLIIIIIIIINIIIEVRKKYSTN